MNDFDETLAKSEGKGPKKTAKSAEQSAAKTGINKRRVVVLGSSVAVVLMLVVTTGYIFSASRKGEDYGAGSSTAIARVPTVPNDSFAPVGTEEADRRATLNDEVAGEAAGRGDSHVSQTVIADKYQVGDERDPFQEELKKVELREAEPEQKPAAEPQVIEKIVYVDRPLTDPVIDPSVIGKIDSQIQYAQKPQQSRFVAMAFKKPAPSQPVQTASAGTGAIANIAGNFDPSAVKPLPVLVAKPGDIFYGQLWLGFNSDDPRGAPVYATIYDNRADGTNGPLHGARLEGSVAYSDRNAALQFSKIIAKDGTIINASALAVDERNARLGIAQKVDFHTFERYSSLLVSTLIEGVGEAANTMLTNNKTVTYLPDTDTIVSQSNDKDQWTKAGLAALRPLGSALSGAARQGFNRPPTISANRGHNVGIVFTSPVEM